MADVVARPPLAPVARLSEAQVKRYGRQMLVASFGAAGQRRLLSASFLVIGAGGLGCPAALYLAAAGVGRLCVVDHDVVEQSNLHRQVGHSEERLGWPKAVSLVEAARQVNPEVEYLPVVEKFEAANGLALVRAFDVVLDATDNPTTRYLINDACVLADRPLVSGAALGTDGQASVYHARGSPCYRCLFPVPPAPGTTGRCSDQGVLGPVVGVIGALQAMEALKVAVESIGASLAGHLLVWDAADARMRQVRLRPRNPSCASCGASPSVRALDDTEVFCSCAGLAAVEGGLDAEVAVGSPVPSVEEDAALAVLRQATVPSARPGDDPGAVEGAIHSWTEFENLLDPAEHGEAPLVLDVRAEVQVGLVRVPGSAWWSLADLARSLPPAVRAGQAEVLDANSSSSSQPSGGAQRREDTGGGGAGGEVASATGGEERGEVSERDAGDLERARDAVARVGTGGVEEGSCPTMSVSEFPSLPDALGQGGRRRQRPVWVLCRRGVDSADATQRLRSVGVDAYNLAGGLERVKEWY